MCIVYVMMSPSTCTSVDVSHVQYLFSDVLQIFITSHAVKPACVTQLALYRYLVTLSVAADPLMMAQLCVNVRPMWRVTSVINVNQDSMILLRTTLMAANVSPAKLKLNYRPLTHHIKKQIG